MPGEYPNYPDGKNDGTHFQEMGAMEMSRLIIEGIRALENDTNMTFLINALLPTWQINIAMNCLEAGLVTHSGRYPAGAQITLKTRLKAGYHFNHWEDTVNNIISTMNLHKFTMPAHDTDFIASVSDCNGDSGGSASYDDCGSCSGGNTGITPCTMAFQSENACFYDGVVGTVTVNDYKRYYINTANYDRPGVTYSINAPADTMCFFGIVYSTDDSLEKLDVLVNADTIITSLELDATDGWNIVPVALNLRAGINIVRVVSQSTSGGILFDLLAVYSEGLSRGSSCKLQGIRGPVNQDMYVYPNPTNTGYTISLPGKFEYRVYNISGCLLVRGICMNTCYFGEELKNGLYLMQTIQDKKSHCQLIYKEP